MKVADAPDPGWFPDPENRSRLRWWDGTDWSDIRRAVPSEAELIAYEETHLETAAEHAATVQQQYMQAQQQMGRVESQQLIDEVRRAARDEVNRAGEMFTQRARSAAKEITPLVSEYTNRIIRWIRFAVIVAVVLLVAWFVFQVIFQASLFEWIGDRIDNFTNSDDGG